MSDARAFPVEYEHRVYWGEMDAFGHVNNTQYVRWFESARIAYFERVAVAIGAQDTSPWIPILARSTIDYRKPVTYPDQVSVGARVLKLGNTSFTMAYRAVSRAQGLVAEGESVLVLLDPVTGQKTPLPQALRDSIERLEASAGYSIQK